MTRPSGRGTGAAVAAALLLLGGCSAGTDGPDSAATREAEASRSPTADPAATATTAPTPSALREALPPVRFRPSLPALMRAKPRGGGMRVRRTVARTADYTRLEVTYRSDDLRVSGVLLRPRGEGPFPAIVLNHGYIAPSVYDIGQGMAREQEALARRGFVVLHTDYRGHGASTDVGGVTRDARVGYTRDAINAVDTLRGQPYVDGDRLAMMGRSMGGGVTMNALVASPGLVDAAVLYASVSSDFTENLRHFGEPGETEAITRRYGPPAQNRARYRALSPRTYFDRITEPVLALHGAVDETCPPRWARETQRLMQRAGVDSRLHFYPGEGHVFDSRWQDSMDRSVRFLRQQFRA